VISIFVARIDLVRLAVQQVKGKKASLQFKQWVEHLKYKLHLMLGYVVLLHSRDFFTCHW